MKYLASSIITALAIILIPSFSRAQAPSPAPVDEMIVSEKRIDVDLSEQKLAYFFGDIEMGTIYISSGLRYTPTPVGNFKIQFKRPIVLYAGAGYYYPNTKWNLQFLPHYYIHGAYWHNNFGRPMSHGCINVAYADMERLYDFTDIGTPVTIHE